MIRALLDTNVVVSAFLWGGVSQQIIAHITTNDSHPIRLHPEPPPRRIYRRRRKKR